MGARAAAAGRARGGEGISALRQARARLKVGSGALAVLGGVVAFSAETGGRLAPLAAGLGAAALVLLALGIVLRRPQAIPSAVVLAGTGYLAPRFGRTSVDGWAAFVGAGLLLTAEIGFLAVGHDARLKAERALVVSRALTSGGLVAAALLLDFLLLAAAAVSASSSVVLAAAGVAAAVSAVAVVLRLLRT
jgi:hypothetical protein